VTPNELRAFVLARLVAQANLQVWDGAPGDGTLSLGFRPGERDVALDGDGRAHIHAAAYIGSGGIGFDDERMSATGGTVVSTFDVIAVGGDINRCNLAVTKVKAALLGVRVTAAGIIRLDFDPGAPQVEREPTPSRYFVSIPFRVALG
jgi:hypothetical protein